MRQWITRINRYESKDHRQPIKNELQPKVEKLPAVELIKRIKYEEETEDEGEHYDTVIVRMENRRASNEVVEEEVEEEEEEEEEIYEVIR